MRWITYNFKKVKAINFLFFCGRGGEIRTPDPLVPNQMRYQTALHPAQTLLLSLNKNEKLFFIFIY